MLTLIVLLGFFGLTYWLVWYMVRHDRGAKEPTSALWEAFGLGVAGAVLAAVLEYLLISKTALSGPALSWRFGSFMLVGVIEEAAKFLPLALLIHRRPYFNEFTDGVLYFSLAGLAFALVENIVYLLIHGPVTGIFRIIVLLYFHAATSGIIGYFFAKHKLIPEKMTKTLLALVAMMTLHGLYDFGLSSGLPELLVLSVIIVASLNTGLFLFYRQAQINDRSLGLSAVGSNQFCRHCGRPNLHQTLYCEFCGQKT